jgi:hypothetical protein
VRKLRAMLPDGAIVMPGHGSHTDARTLDFTIAYLETLDKQVGDAVAQGLSEADAVQRIGQSRQQYDGYRLYPWVHTQTNVTKTGEGEGLRQTVTVSGTAGATCAAIHRRQ